MAQHLLMPRATAVWLVDNSTLTFSQIGELCSMHELEIQSIADGESDTNIIGQSPVRSSQITAEELARCEADPTATVQLRDRAEAAVGKTSRTRYTPISMRRNKPDAIAYILKHYPQLSDRQIEQLIGTTKKTIERIREGTHRKSNMIEMKDPIIAGLCTSAELDEAITKADARLERQKPTAPEANP